MLRPARLTDYPLPPYSYVTGQFPHPLSDPQGHGCPGPEDDQRAFDPERWREFPLYLWGTDLFNQGFYWEAHEAWETLWHRLARSAATALFLKGLIKLAAAGVKFREGRPQGVRRHAQRAAELFRILRKQNRESFAGHDLRRLISLAEKTADQASSTPAMADIRLYLWLDPGNLHDPRDGYSSCDRSHGPS